MICKFVIIGTVHEEPKPIDAHSIVFQVVSKVGMFETHLILITVTAHDALAKQFANLKRGAQVLVDGEPRTTNRGNPVLHFYEDGEPYVLYEVTARNILPVKSLV